MSNKANIEPIKGKVKDFLKHSPPPIETPVGLLGWNIGDEFICARCASRLMKIGCWRWTFRQVEVVWDDSEFRTPSGPCVGHEEEYAMTDLLKPYTPDQ